MGYILGGGKSMDWTLFGIFALGGMCLTGASNILNQVYEKDSDKLMDRTKKRPVPTGSVSVPEAIFLASVLGALSIFLFAEYFNFKTAILGFASLVLYAFAYTPLKTKTPLAVFVGAIPGALPPMIGWIAATDKFGWEPGILFGIQFFWQLPHYWAIAWVLDEDYQKAGIRLLPNAGGRTSETAFQIMIYTLFLIPLGFMPYFLGMTGITSAIVTLIAGILFLAQTFYLMKECSKRAALLIMFGSFLYLPIVQIAFVLDKV
ncbi:protoheme IX farnesyltransferase [Sporocytophaga myxococcoides]|uniref:Protoheme IX farnesyltransferase n=2 Tax=Sporocytophaga myxococcoides TaxID=153721 RepID=A0A098LLZ4_9BACT|nr:protoheme IX farnesyltransferase [Sporocytophaga myxococcoides]